MYFIKPALADTASALSGLTGGEGGSSMLTSMMPLFVILAVFYFMVIRPQNKRLQSHREMINNLKKGDKIVTGGGLIVKIKKLVGDDELLIELSDGVEASIMRSTVMMMKETKPAAKKD